jgi:Autophagy receptor ATG43
MYSEDEVNDSASSSHVSDRSGRRSTKRSKNTNIPIKSVPDLRFEQSYLASIRGFIHEEDDQNAKAIKNSENSTPIDLKNKKSESHLLDVRTTRSSLLYLTVRDQLLSPIIQGAVFGMAGLAFGQFRNFLIARKSSGRQGKR